MNQPLNPRDPLLIPPMMVQTFRTALAVQRGVEKNLLLKTWGGLGDQICAEPTLRFALRTFKGCRISLASEHPELFAHLEFAEVFDLKKVKPVEENYLVFDTIVNTDHLLWEFMSHMLVNCVDFPSICAFRCQLPVKDKEVMLAPSAENHGHALDLIRGTNAAQAVVVHPGRHWQSKTFPKHWWDDVLAGLVARGKIPILIGGDTDDNRGTVDVDTVDCLDLRNKLSIMESVALLSHSTVLLTNDSAPVHMAAAGSAWIGFIATCKHPDYISHWRKGEWSWRMENLGLGGIWDVLDYCPNTTNRVEAENVGEENLKEWLPEPMSVVDWACSKFQED